MLLISDLSPQQKKDMAISIQDTSSFFVKYFNLLPKFKTREECFNYLNDIYLEIFGAPKYSSFASFLACLYRDGEKYLKSKK